MLRFFTKNISPIAVILITFSILAFFYGPVLFQPQDYILSDKGDGIKNYYCFEWHVHNDTSFVNYSGSNYPFGENHGYTDGNPLLSNTLRLLPFINSWSIALFNLTLLLSFVVCALLLFKILKEFEVKDFFGVVAAVGITFLCPQVFRLSGHFALAYNFCIPLTIYLLIKQEKTVVQKKYGYIIAFYSLCFLFIHPYLGMIVSSFLLFYWLFKPLFVSKAISSSLVSLFFQVIIPLATYFLITKLTDTHVDRGVRPYGFFYFTSSIETIFISTHKPFRHFLSQIYPIKGQNQEGLAYVGIVSLVSAFGFLLFLIKRRRTIKDSFERRPLAKMYLTMTMSAIVLLVFSMGYPFKMGMEGLADVFPVIVQFRAVGRFAWVFFFVATIGATVLISNYFAPRMKKNVRLLFCGALLTLFFFEGLPFQKDVSSRVIVKNCFKYGNLEDELKSIISVVNAKKPQAIVPLPFFHVGTDYYNIPGTDKIITASLKVCYHSKTPLMANLTARNSLTEAENLIQVIGSRTIEKDIASKIRSRANFFILYSKENISDEELLFLEKGSTVLETDNFIVKEITPERLVSNSVADKQREFLSAKPRLGSRSGSLLSDTTFFYFDGFDSLPNGQFQGNAGGHNLVKQFPPGTFLNSRAYEISFWYKTKDRLDLDNVLSVLEVNANNDTTVIASRNIKTMLNVRQGRVFSTLAFKPERPEDQILICLNGISDREKVFFIDDLMVKEKVNDFYRPRNTSN